MTVPCVRCVCHLKSKGRRPLVHCTGKLWSREKLMAHCGGVVVAGMDTTAHAVSWAM